jgi:hypothetical protein
MRSRLALFLALAALLSACGGDPPERWRQEVALDTGGKLGGCVIADLDPDLAGNEIAVVGGDGAVFVLSRAQGSWTSKKVAELPGEMIQCAAGRLDPGSEAVSLVTVGAASGGEDDGGPGVAWRIRKVSGQWERERIFQDAALLHGVCIGDLDPDHDGDELLVAGYTNKAHLINNDGGAWKVVRSLDLDGQGKGAAVVASGAVVACADGSVMLLERSGRDWESRLLRKFPAPQARIAGLGDAVLVCDNGGDLRLIQDQRTDVVFSATDRLRGAVFADVDPKDPVRQAATAGYDGAITLIRGGLEGPWRAEKVGHDTNKLHHLATGEILGYGTALVACGYSGRVIVVWCSDR